MHQHKKTRGVLPTHAHTTQDRFIERRVVAAADQADAAAMASFNRLTKHLEKDPEPRFLFANRRRSANALACPGMDAVRAARITMRAALASGNAKVIEATAIEIDAFFAELHAAALVAYHEFSNTPSLAETALSGIKEVGEATHAVAEALVTRSPGDIERALVEATEAEVALHRFTEVARTTRAAVRRPETRSLVMAVRS